MSDSTAVGTEGTSRTTRICVVGLGYVGLPLAAAFDDAGHDVSGFDVDAERVNTLEDGSDPTGDVEYVVVTVPTPVDDLEKPDLEYITRSGRTIGRYLEPGTTVVLESTVYPGATRSVFAPAIEETSGMIAGSDFGVGYSPERVVPGDENRSLRDVVKIVSALTDETREDLADLFETVVDVGVHHAPSIETAETAKCVENTQRDLNIALVNELAVACGHLGLDTQAVLEAARTKWNFHDYRPGLVGGHCIPVDPFYLIYESERNGFTPELIRKAREINEYVPQHVAEMTIKALNHAENVLQDSRVLVLGLSYKPNVGDVRTSAIDGVIEALIEYGITVVGYDPVVDDDEARDQFGIDVLRELSATGTDAVVIGTHHDEFDRLDFRGLIAEMNENPVIVDVTGEVEDRTAEHVHTYRRL